ncbi:MAG: hypothetical protein A4E72_01258 [Syntrophus sp. PtaU1.Bin208]|nr:MAG: hypothetical protein A4E72_01258 [Syntrophus sp. PtaU1.Bin208]
MIRGPLDVGLAAHGLNAATGDAHIAQKQLDHAHGPDILGSYSVLGPAHGVEFVPCPVRSSCRAVELVDLDQFVNRRSRDLVDDLRRVAGIVLLQELEDAVGILHRGILFDPSIPFSLVGPAGLVVFSVRQPRKDAVVVAGKLEVRIHKEGRIGVVFDILFKVELVFDDILDHPAEKGDVRP